MLAKNGVCNLSLAFAFAAMTVLAIVSNAEAQTDGVKLTATSANVSEPGHTVRMSILRWSTDEERDAIVRAMTSPAGPAKAPAGGRGAATARPSDEFADFQARNVLNNSCTACHTLDRVDAASYPAEKWQMIVSAMRERGAMLTNEDLATLLEYLTRTHVPAAPLDSVAALAAAIHTAPTIGFVWTNDVTGYPIKYAYRISTNGNERIILATERRLGSLTAGWKPVTPPAATDYTFTIIEVLLDAKGTGEGKTSLNTKVTVDANAKTIALDNYAATPTILRNVKR